MKAIATLVILALVQIGFAAVSPPSLPDSFSASVFERGNGTQHFFRWFYDYPSQKGKLNAHDI